MSASEIVVEELLPQKRYHNNIHDCTGTNEKTYCSCTTKKSIGRIKDELNIGISSKYLINTQLLIKEWLTLRTA